MKYGLDEKVLNSIIKVFSRCKKIDRLILFGSRAKGNYKIGSDIDLALIGKDISINDLNKLYLQLDDLYLPYTFDLIIFEKIDNEELIDHINRVGIPIYSSKERS